MDYKEHYQQDAIVFDYFKEEDIGAAELRRNQYIFELSRIKEGQRILDIGSGRGWFSLYAASQGAVVTALDLSQENLQRIRSLDPSINTVFGDACNIPFPEHKYDLIVALEVLEHIPEPDLALKSIRQVLKPDGILLITVPYKEAIRYSLCIHCNRKTPFNAHLHSFDTCSMAAMLRRNRFRITRHKLFVHKLMNLLRITPLMAGLPLKLWQIVDQLCGLGNDKYGFLAVTAKIR